MSSVTGTRERKCPVKWFEKHGREVSCRHTYKGGEIGVRTKIGNPTKGDE